MVSSEASEGNNSLLLYGTIDHETWEIGWTLCGASNSCDCDRLDLASYADDATQKLEAIKNWNLRGYKIENGLSNQRSLQDSCSVDYSFAIMLGWSCPVMEHLELIIFQLCVFAILLNVYPFTIL